MSQESDGINDRYYLTLANEQKGPYTLSQLQSMWKSGVITADTLYCQEGFDQWVSISTIAQTLDGQTATGIESAKRILPALILCFLFGVFGVHAFYAGRIRQGLLFLALPVTGYLCMYLGMVLPFRVVGLVGWIPMVVPVLMVVFALGDLIRILIGSYKDGKGRKITKWT